ncbi:hypothetical protein L1987_25038 [Smallanthus sonchifolius]|uniref:Uncharacterized protein n=1 Tax=Smallanthus sonchifolius TaxID=185202 RepID=A0ACB9IM46_9ASTR|nr:hypothetical protein L1987_25038 [Smallanthus sonchifolius]
MLIEHNVDPVHESALSLFYNLHIFQVNLPCKNVHSYGGLAIARVLWLFVARSVGPHWAYKSFANLNSALPFNNWPDPSVELMWAPPPEPPCTKQAHGDSTSTCRDALDGTRRCFCKSAFLWDAATGQCVKGRSQKGQKKKDSTCCIYAIDFGRPAEDVNLVAYIKRIVNEERLVDVIDPMIKKHTTSLDIDAMKAFGFLVMSCLEELRENRPSMKEISEEIAYIIGIVATTVEDNRLLQFVHRALKVVTYAPNIVCHAVRVVLHVT